MKPKLVPLKEWYCDTCGELITKATEGVLLKDKNAEGVIDHYKITHHRIIKKGCDNRSMDLFSHLDDFQDRALSELISGEIHSKYEESILKEILARVLVPYYEEARRLFPIAEEDNFFVPPYPEQKFSERICRQVIELYSDIDKQSE